MPEKKVTDDFIKQLMRDGLSNNRIHLDYKVGLDRLRRIRSFLQGLDDYDRWVASQKVQDPVLVKNEDTLPAPFDPKDVIISELGDQIEDLRAEIELLRARVADYQIVEDSAMLPAKCAFDLDSWVWVCNHTSGSVRKRARNIFQVK